jgi:uncharacterized membrane protein YphA (DoxX/SURF4 family)
MTLLLRLLVCLCLMFSGIAKLRDGVSGDAILPPIAASALAYVECVAGLCVGAGVLLRPCAWFAVVLAMAGGMLALFFPMTNCGCFGKLVLSPPQRLALAATLGVCAVLLLDSKRVAPSKPTSMLRAP